MRDAPDRQSMTSQVTIPLVIAKNAAQISSVA